MKAKEFPFASEDVTTLYDALRTCSAADVAGALVRPGGEGGVAARRASSLLQVLMQLGPNLEASGMVLLPWKPSHCAAFSSMAWPDALGCRIVLPAAAPPKVRQRLLTNILLNLSYV